MTRPGASGHYFDAQPAARSRPRVVELALADVTLSLVTDRGVFSGTRVDPGTKVLLQSAPRPPRSGEILDLGCGYGPISVALALRAPQARVWAVDVNERALELTRTNAANHGVTNLVACLPDEVPAEVRFSVIYSNPPARIGKAALHAILVRWLDRLLPDGRALLVVQKNLGSDSLARWLDGQAYPTRRLTSKNAYRLLEVQPRST